MAEIKIEKKNSIIPWILLILGIVAAIWYFVLRTDEPKTTPSTAKTELIDVQENNERVVAYVSFINADQDKIGLDPEFTSAALSKLTDAVDAMATQINFDVTADISKAKELADKIERDPMATTHSATISAAATLLSTSLQNMQKANYPSLSIEANAVKTAASGIDSGTLALDQREAIKLFFNSAAELLTKMN
jgi:hypothetical protein